MSEEAKSFLINRITKYRGSEHHYGTNVTAIVNILLDLCNIRGIYGYIIKDESFMISIRRNLSIEVMNRKSDKAVFKYQDRPIRGNYLVDDEKPLLVIECKSHKGSNDIFQEDDVDQLTTYMSSIKFPYGILISEYKADFYKGSYSLGKLNITTDGMINDIAVNVDSLIDFIKNACSS